jgi:hypothetical protein
MRFRPLVVAATSVAAFLAAAVPAFADTLTLEGTVAPANVQPGDTFTVTESVNNDSFSSILGPTIRVLGGDAPIVSWADLVTCTTSVGATCTTVDDPSGPVGYMAVLAGAIGGHETVQVTFTLRVKADAAGASHAVRGQLVGRNGSTDPVDLGPVNVVTQADLAVSVTAAPKFSLLVPRIDVTVKVTNKGPGTLRSAEVRGTLTAGLSANSGTRCTGGAQPVCSFGQLAAGASATGQFSVPLGLLYIGLPYRIAAARTTSSPTDPVSGNDSAATTCTVVTPLLVTCG